MDRELGMIWEELGEKKDNMIKINYVTIFH